MTTPADTTESGHCDDDLDGTTICWDENNYATCSHGKWTVRPCSAGTVCQENDGNVTCGWGDS